MKPDLSPAFPQLSHESPDLSYRLDRADLVIRGHNGDKNCVVGERGFDILDPDQSVRINWKIRDSEILFFEIFAHVFDGGVFDH